MRRSENGGESKREEEKEKRYRLKMIEALRLEDGIARQIRKSNRKEKERMGSRKRG